MGTACARFGLGNIHPFITIPSIPLPTDIGFCMCNPTAAHCICLVVGNFRFIFTPGPNCILKFAPLGTPCVYEAGIERPPFACIEVRSRPGGIFAKADLRFCTCCMLKPVDGRYDVVFVRAAVVYPFMGVR